MNLELHLRAILATLLISIVIVIATGSSVLSEPSRAVPHFVNCPQEWLESTCTSMVVYDFDAVDDDPGDQVKYYLGPNTGGAIDSITGYWEWGMTGAGVYDLTIIAVDKASDTAFCEFVVMISTEAPYFVGCPDDTTVTTVVIGGLIEGSVSAVDPDGCPNPLRYTLVDFAGPGIFQLDTIRGDWYWLTRIDDDYVGEFAVSISVSDGYESGMCTFTIDVLPTFDIWIGAKMLQQQGQLIDLPIYFSDETDYIAGFDFLIQYDSKMLTFVEANIGSDLGPDGCSWEYFTYRYESPSDCGGPCLGDLIRFVALAEYDHAPPYPNCFGGDAIELLTMRYLVTANANFQCKYSPIRFYWVDCGDNSVSSVSGDTLWLSTEVYDFDANLDSTYVPVTGLHGIGGHTGIEGVDCIITSPSGNKPIEGIIFKGGGIRTECIADMIIYGDMNLNRTPNEVADVVLFLSYFTWGLGVFTIDAPAQIETSDVNRDDRVLTTGDLVFMIRRLEGLPVELSKLAQYEQTVMIEQQETADGIVISSKSDSDIGAIYIRYRTDDLSPEPILLSDGMQVKWSVSDGELRILIYSMSGNIIDHGDNDLLLIKNSGRIDITDVSISDGYGSLLNVEHGDLIKRAVLYLDGNSPNPFNPRTSIRFYLPSSSLWKIEVFNITGQKVDELRGHDNAGHVSATWDAAYRPSGIYLYRITACGDVVTGKMLLMK